MSVKSRVTVPDGSARSTRSAYAAVERRPAQGGACRCRTHTYMGSRTPPNRWMRDTAPFAGMALLGLLAAGTPSAVWVRPEWLGSTALTLLAGALLLVRPLRTRVPFAAHVAGAAYLVAVALLRDASAVSGGGLGMLVLLPVIACALYGRPRDLPVAIAGTAA